MNGALERTVVFDLEQERQFTYTGLNLDAVVSHLCDFVSRLWQLRPFAEGNTRTTAVFLIKYLRSMGFEADNEPFKENSWYFRNALVRAHYTNIPKGISPTSVFLERFMRNHGRLSYEEIAEKWERALCRRSIFVLL